jgi:hypothetical protein
MYAVETWALKAGPVILASNVMMGGIRIAKATDGAGDKLAYPQLLVAKWDGKW